MHRVCGIFGDADMNAPLRHSDRFPINIREPFYTLFASDHTIRVCFDRDEIADAIEVLTDLWREDRVSGSWQVWRSEPDGFCRDVSEEFYPEEDAEDYPAFDRECSRADRLIRLRKENA
jgi:hypothetical protein